jgi:hypothetical protein
LLKVRLNNWKLAAETKNGAEKIKKIITEFWRKNAEKVGIVLELCFLFFSYFSPVKARHFKQ